SGTVLNAFTGEIVAYENESDETHALKKLDALCTLESFVTHSNFDTPGGTVYYILKYDAEAGFVVRRSCQKRLRNGDVKTKYLVCNRKGCTKDIHVDTLDLENSDKQKRNSNLHITGCKARVVFNLDPHTRKFVLKVFDTIHNHELEREEFKHLSKRERKLTYLEQTDFVFETKDGAETIRHYMQTSAPQLKVKSNVIDTFSLILNHEQKMNINGNKIKYFFHTTMIKKDMFKWKKENEEYDEEKQFEAFLKTIKSEFIKDPKMKNMKDLEMAFFSIIAHEHYYLVVFNFLKGNTVIIDNSKTKMTYDAKYKTVCELLDAIGGTIDCITFWGFNSIMQPSSVNHKIQPKSTTILSSIPSGTVVNAFTKEIIAYEKESDETHVVKKLDALCTPESFVTHSNFDTPGGTVYYIPKYAAEAGFVVRSSCQKRLRNRDVKTKYLVCNRKGCTKGIHVDTLDLKNSDKQKRNSYLHITGCKTHAVFNLDPRTRKLVLNVFDTIHNHELEREEFKHLSKRERKLSYLEQAFIVKAASVNIGATRAHHLTKNLIPALRNKRNRYGEKNVVVENFVNETTSIVDYYVHLLSKDAPMLRAFVQKLKSPKKDVEAVCPNPLSKNKTDNFAEDEKELVE
nr:ulp1 protease family, C-terminal catalytic domain-containing protein [Tanacetum cinerariifolium]